jgi:uncharacterized protein (TIGR02145 family)
MESKCFRTTEGYIGYKWGTREATVFSMYAPTGDNGLLSQVNISGYISLDEFEYGLKSILKSRISSSDTVEEKFNEILSQMRRDGVDVIPSSVEQEPSKIFSCTAPQIEQNEEVFIDIDGNTYHTIKIGKQVWTVENLKTTKYNDGTAIPLVSDKGTWSSYNDDKKHAYCWYNDDKSKNEKYGALYNWYAVNTGKLAPKGWHVPTDAEWTELEEYLIANGYNWDGSKEGNKIAKALAAKTDWNSDNDSGKIGNDLGKNNRSGFSALPGGCRNDDGSFSYVGKYGHWWSATERDASRAYYRYLYYFLEHLTRSGYDGKGCGFSVRLLRDLG